MAAELATQSDPGGLVLESAFTSIPDVAQAMYPFLPVRWLVRHRYDAERKLGHVTAPVLILHGESDEYLPPAHARRLAAAAAGPARLVMLRGGHNDAFLVSGETYRRAVCEFLAHLASRRHLSVLRARTGAPRHLLHAPPPRREQHVLTARPFR